MISRTIGHSSNYYHDPRWEIIWALRRTINLLVTNPRITEWLTVEGSISETFLWGSKMTRAKFLLDNGHFITAWQKSFMTSSSRPRKHKEGFRVRLCRALKPLCVLRCSLFVKVIGLMSRPCCLKKVPQRSSFWVTRLIKHLRQLLQYCLVIISSNRLARCCFYVSRCVSHGITGPSKVKHLEVVFTIAKDYQVGWVNLPTI